eukprot:310906-Chlamydomonas_euryale.AAC.3
MEAARETACEWWLHTRPHASGGCTRGGPDVRPTGPHTAHLPMAHNIVFRAATAASRPDSILPSPLALSLSLLPHTRPTTPASRLTFPGV